MIRVGIDLGTTNTLACCIKNGKPEIIKFPGGKMLPSVLYVEEDKSILIGSKAKKKGRIDPVNQIRSSKTFMGDYTKRWNIRGKVFTPTDVATEILKEVKKAVIKSFKADENEEIEAIITVPAYFNSNKRDETQKAGEKAGFKVLGIVTEPRAAAVANIKELGIDNEKIFVVDLGGGTFDVSVLSVNNKEYTTIDTDGDHKLGGDDFDNCLFEHMKKHIEDDLGMDLSSQNSSGLSYKDYYSMIGSIYDEACEAKIELSDEEKVEITIPNLFPYKDGFYNFELTITREKFYELCEELFSKINNRILKVMKNNNLAPEDIQNVILAGGSCYIPKIKDDVERIFKQSADTTIDRSTMVVVGACFIADTWDDISNTKNDIISHSLGVAAYDDDDNTLVLEKIIPRGTVYPCDNFKKEFTTKNDNQETVCIQVYEAGNDMEDVRAIEQNGKVVHDLYGSFEFTGIEKAPAGEPVIEVAFSYDRSGILTVTAKEKGKNAVKSVVVSKGQNLREKKITQSVSFEILIDTSGSMNSNNGIHNAKKAAVKLVSEIVDLSVHKVGIIGFGSKINEVSVLSQNKAQLISGIEKLSASGTTAMDEAIEKAIQRLKAESTKKVIIIVTDGSPTDVTSTTMQAEQAVKAGIDVMTIAAGTADKKYLEKIASKKEYAFSIGNMSQLSDMFQTAVEQYLKTL